MNQEENFLTTGQTPVANQTSGEMTPGQMNQTAYENGGGNWVKILLIIFVIIIGIIAVVAIVWFFKNQTKLTVLNNNATTTNVTEVYVSPVDLYPNDKDRDGLPDDQEKQQGLSIDNFDTDGDGLSDSDEINTWHTSPTSTDSDGDGFGDGWEVIKGFNPVGEGKLNQ